MEEYKCEFCNKIFDKEDYLIHIKTHSNISLKIKKINEHNNRYSSTVRDGRSMSENKYSKKEELANYKNKVKSVLTENNTDIKYIKTLSNLSTISKTKTFILRSFSTKTIRELKKSGVDLKLSKDKLKKIKEEKKKKKIKILYTPMGNKR